MGHPGYGMGYLVSETGYLGLRGDEKQGIHCLQDDNLFPVN